MDTKFLIILALLYLDYQLEMCYSESVSVTYINTEHPVVEWFDEKYFVYFNLTNHRINRNDPRYYVGINTKTLQTLGNNLKLDFYFYQFLTNRYRPSFIELHFRFCDLVGSDSFIGSTLKRAFNNRPCPFTPDTYDLQNLSLAYVPAGFPFTKGRIYCNLTMDRGGSFKFIGNGYIDIELKVGKITNREKKTKQ